MSQKIKNILFVTRPLTPPWDEASKIFAYDLARTIQTPHRIHIMTAGILPDMPSNVVQHPIYTQSHFDFGQKVRSLLFQIRNRREFDVVHFFFTPAKLNAFLNKRIFNSPRVHTIQTVATLREDLYSDDDLREVIFGKTIITYTDASNAKLSSLGYPNVRTIPPGVDFAHYAPAPKDEEVLKQFNLTEDDFIVTSPGEYIRLGATDTIVEMLTIYFKKFPSSPMKFIFANRLKGSASAKRKKEEVIKKLTAADILDRVRFVDIFSDMPKLYNLSDVVVFPVKNLHGKFDVPLVIPEAMACEKAVILSDLPQLDEFAKSESVVTIPKGDSNKLAESIEELRINSNKQQILATQARAYALSRFSLDAVAKGYEKLYEGM